jgi:thiol-disulfide isomerase/thioredoxin
MIVILALGSLALATVVLSGWLLFSLHGSQERIAARMDNVARRLAPPPAAAGPAGIQRLAPNVALLDLDGRTVALSALMATGKRVLLNFTDPRCGPCYELLADVGGWEHVYGDRLTIVTVSGGDVRQNRMLAQEYGLGTVLLQQEHELADAFELPMLPAAVLIEPDGRVADSATGAPAVRQLVASALGLALPPQPVREGNALQPGQQVGDLRRPDLNGNLIDLGERRADPTLLLFWSPGCSHCQDLLPAMRDWDAEPDGPRMVVVTSGPAGLNRDAGLRAPMIQDDEGELKRTFGVLGTTAAVLIDGDGRVATDVARGTTGVRSLVAERYGALIAAD